MLDGGNVVHNGKVAIVTEKVWLDNPLLSKREIERAIISIGFEQVVMIPVEPDDNVGHADGIVRFLQSDLLLVNRYDDPHFRAYKLGSYGAFAPVFPACASPRFPGLAKCTKQMASGLRSAVI